MEGDFNLDDVMPQEPMDTDEVSSDGEFYDANIKENTYAEEDIVLPEESPVVMEGNNRRVADIDSAEAERRKFLLDSVPPLQDEALEQAEGEPEKTEMDILSEEITDFEKEDEPSGFLDALNKAGEEGSKILDAVAKEHKEVSQDPAAAGRVLLGGIGDAAEGTVNAIIDVVDGIENKSIGLFGFNIIEEGAKLEVMDKLIPRGQHPSEDIARGLVSFGVAFAGISKVVGASKYLNTAFQFTGKTGIAAMPALTKGMSVGAMADVLAFDPEDGNLSTLLVESGASRWWLTEYLNSKEADSRLEGRVKNVLEGALLGIGIITVESVGFLSGLIMGGLKTYKTRKIFKAAVLQKKILTQKASAKLLGQETKAPKKLESVIKADYIDKVKKLATDKTPYALKKAADAKQFAEAAGIKVPTAHSISPDAVAEHRAVKVMEDLLNSKPIPTHAGGRSIAPLKATKKEVQRLISTIREFDHDGEYKAFTDEQLIKQYRNAPEMTLADLMNNPEPERFTNIEVFQSRIIEAKAAMYGFDVLEDMGKGLATEGDFIKVMDLQSEITKRVKVVGTAKSLQLQAMRTPLPKTMGSYLSVMEQINQIIPEGDFRRAQFLMSTMKPTDVPDVADKARFMPWVEALVEWKIDSLLASVTTGTKNIVGLTGSTGLTVAESATANLIGKIRATIHNDPNLITHTGAARIEFDAIIKTLHNTLILAAEDIKVAKSGKTSITKKDMKTLQKDSPYEAAKAELIKRTKGIQSLYEHKGLTGEPAYKGQVEGSDKVDAIKRRKIISTELSGGNKVFGELIDIVGDLVNMPITGLVTSDEFYKTMFMNMYKERTWATREAGYIQAGLEPDEIAIAYKLHMRDPIIMKEARQYSEYLSLTNPIPDAKSNMVTSPEGQFTLPTQTNVLSFGKGTASKTLETAVRLIPGSRIIVPFLNVGINASRMATERVPGMGFMLPEVRQAFSQRKENPAAWNTVLARQALGGSLMVLGIGLSINNQVTGNGPGNREQYRFWSKDLGNVPNAIKVGKNWYPLSLFGPLGDVLALGATLGELGNYSREHEASFEELARDIALAVGTVYEPEYLINNLGSLSKIIREADEDALMRLATSQWASMVPSFVNRIRRGVDPTKRITAEDKQEEGAMGYLSRVFNESFNKLKNAIPGWSDSLPVDTNRLGKPILYPEGIASNLLTPIASTSRQDGAVEDELNRLNMAYAPLVEKEVLKKMPNGGKDLPVFIKHLRPQIKPRGFKGSPIQLTTEQFLEYKRLAAGMSPTEDSREGLYKFQAQPHAGVMEPIYDVLKEAVDNGFKDIPALHKKHLGEDYARRAWIYNVFEQYRVQAESQIFKKYFYNNAILLEEAAGASSGLPSRQSVKMR